MRSSSTPTSKLGVTETATERRTGASDENAQRTAGRCLTGPGSGEYEGRRLLPATGALRLRDELRHVHAGFQDLPERPRSCFPLRPRESRLSEITTLDVVTTAGSHDDTEQKALGLVLSESEPPACVHDRRSEPKGAKTPVRSSASSRATLETDPFARIVGHRRKAHPPADVLGPRGGRHARRRRRLTTPTISRRGWAAPNDKRGLDSP
jgi:hypothetical protein